MIKDKNKMTNKNLIIFASIVIIASMLFSINVVNAYANPAIVNLGEASNFAVLSKVSVSSVPTSIITGDVGISPNGGTSLTGLTCLEVTGTGVPFPIHVASAGGSSLACQTVDPVYLTPTILEMEAAYTDAFSRASDVTMDTDLGGETLTPGVYTTAVDLGITSNLVLNCGGDSAGVFIFRVGGKLDLSSSTNVILSGNCQSGNIFWAVAGTTTINGGIGTESIFVGTVLGGPATSEINLITGSTINGRLLGQKGIALDANIITMTMPDNTIPSISYSSGTELNDSSKSQNYIYVNVSVNETNFKNVIFNLYNSSQELVNATNFTDNNRSANFTYLPDGIYHYNVTAYDAAGNKNSTETYKITLDTYVAPSSGSSGSSGGGGGGGYCSTKWACTDWNTCQLGAQTRECSYPANWCKPIADKPTESQTCILVATPENEVITIENTDTNSGITPITGGIIGTKTTAGKITIASLIILGIAGLIVFLMVKK